MRWLRRSSLAFAGLVLLTAPLARLPGGRSAAPPATVASAPGAERSSWWCSPIVALALDRAAGICGSVGLGVRSIGAELALELLPPVSAQPGRRATSMPLREHKVDKQAEKKTDQHDCPEHCVTFERSAAEPAASRGRPDGLGIRL
jgi:hypothetical protein